MKKKKILIATLLCVSCLFSACKKNTESTNRVIPVITHEFFEPTKPGIMPKVIKAVLKDGDDTDLNNVLFNSKERGNLDLQDLTKVCCDAEGLSWSPYVVDSEFTLTFKYSAKEDTTLTIALFEYNEEMQWNADEAVVVKVCDVESTTEVTWGQFSFDIPDLPEGRYSIVLLEGDRVEGCMNIGLKKHYEQNETLAKKPVIYLYPEQETTVRVTLDLQGRLGCTYPAYNTGWNVIARPDGTMTNLADGRNYEYLFWEGNLDADLRDFGNAACVAGKDTAVFLEKYLSSAGLNDREIDDFISFWLPQMERHEYNLIAFPTAAYEEAAELNIYPKPDSELRIFMVFQELDEPVDSAITEPEPFERNGFTVVEWGGCEIK